MNDAEKACPCGAPPFALLWVEPYGKGGISRARRQAVCADAAHWRAVLERVGVIVGPPEFVGG